MMRKNTVIFILLALAFKNLKSQSLFEEENGIVEYKYFVNKDVKYSKFEFSNFGSSSKYQLIDEGRIISEFSWNDYFGNSKKLNSLLDTVISAYYSNDTSFNFIIGYNQKVKRLKFNSFRFKKEFGEKTLKGVIYLYKNIPVDVRVSLMGKEGSIKTEILIAESICIGDKKIFNKKAKHAEKFILDK